MHRCLDTSIGYFVYQKIEKLQEISASENTIHYHIAQFIIAEHHEKSDVFYYIENIVKGLLLSRVVYGYIDVKYDEKFKDVCGASGARHPSCSCASCRSAGTPPPRGRFDVKLLFQRIF